MGMTDKQFEYHLQNELKDWKKVQKALAALNIKDETVEEKIKILNAQLKRP